MSVEKKEKLFRGFVIIVLSLMIIGIIAFVLEFSKQKEYKKYEINEDVSIQIGKEEPKKVQLQRYSFTVPKQGEEIIIKKKLKKVDIIQPLLVFDVYHCTFEVYLDGEQIYEYGNDIYKNNGVLGHGYFRVPLVGDVSNKELELRMKVTEKDSFSSLEDIYLIEAGEGYVDVIVRHWITIMTGLTFLCIGFVGVVTSLTRKRFERDTRSLTWISVFAIGISIWMMCNDKVINLFIDNISISTFLEYYSLYVTPLPVALFFANVQVRTKYRKILIRLAEIIFIEDVIISLLHIFNVVHYVVWVPMIQVTMGILVFLMFYTLIRSKRDQEHNQIILVYGMLFVGVTVVLELVRYNLFKYLNNVFAIQISFIPFGTLIFVSTMVYSYCVKMMGSYYDKAEKEVLEKLAYMDTLTNTYNRNKCENILKEMEDEKRQGYLLNFDLNGLKQVNDTEGHARGDAMIKAFAKLLREIFDDKGISGRMGGDEFIVVMYDSTEEQVKKSLQGLEKRISRWNKEHKDNQVSVSYGYAMYNPNETQQIRKVYELADAEMYAFKREIKRRQEESKKGDIENYGKR